MLLDTMFLMFIEFCNNYEILQSICNYALSIYNNKSLSGVEVVWRRTL